MDFLRRLYIDELSIFWNGPFKFLVILQIKKFCCGRWPSLLSNLRVGTTTGLYLLLDL
jgi:hypothetical protein